MDFRIERHSPLRDWIAWLLAAAAGFEAGVAWILWKVRATEKLAESPDFLVPMGVTLLACVAFFVVFLILAAMLVRDDAALEPWCALAVAALLFAAGIAALFLAPEEKSMRLIQRIFYFHVPSAWTGFLAFFLAFVANIAYLARRGWKWDWLGVAATEAGLACCTVVLLTGPIWAKPVWGIWWTWDARLTSTFALWLLYVTYLLLRALLPDPERRARISAIYGIFCFLDVPLVYFSIRLWVGQHPKPVIAGGEGSGLDPVMWRVFLVCWAALLSLMLLLLRDRFRLEKARHEVEELSILAEAADQQGEQSASIGRYRKELR